MSGLLKTNAELAKIVQENYVLVLIDVNQGHNDDVVKRYGDPTRFGLPVLVVLDTDGTQLTTQDTGKLEEGNHHDAAKVKAFLENGESLNRTKANFPNDRIGARKDEHQTKMLESGQSRACRTTGDANYANSRELNS